MAGHMMLLPSTMSQQAQSDKDSVDMHGLILQRLCKKHGRTVLRESLINPNLCGKYTLSIAAPASLLVAHLLLNSI